MKFRKTPLNKRNEYTYKANTGEVATIHPLENGVTAEDVKRLHSMDDAEVYNNINNCRPPLDSKERELKKKWENEHPGEKYPSKWNMSIDCIPYDNGYYNIGKSDKSHVYSSLCYEFEYEEETEVDNIKHFFTFLTDIQCTVVYLIMVEKYSQTEVAKMLQTSIPNINKHLKKAVERIKVHEKDFFPRG